MSGDSTGDAAMGEDSDGDEQRWEALRLPLPRPSGRCDGPRQLEGGPQASSAKLGSRLRRMTDRLIRQPVRGEDGTRVGVAYFLSPEYVAADGRRYDPPRPAHREEPTFRVIDLFRAIFTWSEQASRVRAVVVTLLPAPPQVADSASDPGWREYLRVHTEARDNGRVPEDATSVSVLAYDFRSSWDGERWSYKRVEDVLPADEFKVSYRLDCH